MTVVHGLAARYLVDRDDVTTVELARYLGITKQSTSEVVALLEQNGMVRRGAASARRPRPRPPPDRRGAAKLAEGRSALAADRRRVGRARRPRPTRVVRQALIAYLAADESERRARLPADCDD